MKKFLAVLMILCLCLSFAACGKSEQVEKVESAISDIGTVTLDSESLIVAAEELYNALPAEEKGDVENYSKLEDARTTYNKIAVENVKSLIDAIGEVTIDSATAIEAAKTAYNALSSDLQKEISNYDKIADAEVRYERVLLMDKNTIKNFQSFRTKKLNGFNETIDVWYGDKGASATLCVAFLLEGYNKEINFSRVKLNEQHVTICRKDGRVDVYAPYGNGEIMGIQYWPDTNVANIGTITTALTIDEYLELMKECGMIDEYSDIPISYINKVLQIMYS